MVFRSSRMIAVPLAVLTLAAAVMPAVASRSHRASFAGLRHAHMHRKATAPKWTPGQREIDPDRTRAIQSALISRSYLQGEPSGAWDGETEAAMQRFQSDNGWQTKLMPDSRALIKLGLGPSGAAAAQEPTSAHAALEQATGPDTLASSHTVLN